MNYPQIVADSDIGSNIMTLVDGNDNSHPSYQQAGDWNYTFDFGKGFACSVSSLAMTSLNGSWQPLAWTGSRPHSIMCALAFPLSSNSMRTASLKVTPFVLSTCALAQPVHLF